jgi:hypothetical protein
MLELLLRVSMMVLHSVCPMKSTLLAVLLGCATPAFAQTSVPATPGQAPAKSKLSARVEVKAAVAGSRSATGGYSYYYTYRDKGQNIGFTGTVQTVSREPFKAKVHWWILAKDANEGRVVHDCAEEVIPVSAVKPGIFMFGGSFSSIGVRGSSSARLIQGRKYDGWAVRVMGPDGELLTTAGSNEELKKRAGEPTPFPGHIPKPRE